MFNGDDSSSFTRSVTLPIALGSKLVSEYFLHGARWELHTSYEGEPRNISRVEAFWASLAHRWNLAGRDDLNGQSG